MINTNRVINAGFSAFLANENRAEDLQNLWHTVRNAFVRALKRELKVQRLNKDQFEAACLAATVALDGELWNDEAFVKSLFETLNGNGTKIVSDPFGLVFSVEPI